VIETFELSGGGEDTDARLGKALVRAWRSDGILRVAMDPSHAQGVRRAYASSRRFFGQPPGIKARSVSDLTYAGYVATGEQITAGAGDCAELFTVCQDIAPDDPRVRERWPCHGPVPWPDSEFRRSTLGLMDRLGEIGDRLLRLTALGLELDDPDAFARLTWGGWHHLGVVRFPPVSARARYGVGAHTDCGLLTICVHDDGGFYVRRPADGERGAGVEELWDHVGPEPGVFTVFPGDVMAFATDGLLPATAHKALLSSREHFAVTYSHAPNFAACVRPLGGKADSDAGMLYGSQFTERYMRRYPQRATTKRIVADGRLGVLEELRRQAVRAGI
jgi:2-oxoglutarate dioxygenase / 2-oxoglutarate/L-arginine monooxygenase/decarboxylase